MQGVARMIIANRLTDGLVVFYVADGNWTTDIAQGQLIGEDVDVDAKLAAAQADESNCLIIDPQPIDVEEVDGQIRPTAIREAIRAFGPTI